MTKKTAPLQKTAVKLNDHFTLKEQLDKEIAYYQELIQGMEKSRERFHDQMLQLQAEATAYRLARRVFFYLLLGFFVVSLAAISYLVNLTQ